MSGIKDINFEECMGCAACVAVCENAAIIMKQNERGFFKPYVDSTLCKNCNKCKQVCPINKISARKFSKETKVYAAWAKDELIHQKSNSGGLFTVFAKKIIEIGGVVCAACYGKELSVYHKIIDKTEEISGLAYSKFAQSDTSKCMKEVLDILNLQRYVLFVGTPCQISGIKACVGEDDYLITVQFPCFGIPSPIMLKKYVKYKFNENLDRVKFLYCEIQDSTDIDHRVMKCIIEDGTEIRSFAYEDYFVRLWNAGYGIEEHCFECRRNVPTSESDFVWGNFWKIGLVNRFTVDKEKYKNGISFLMVNTEKAEKFFSLVSGDLEYYERNLKEVLAGHCCMQTSIKEHIVMRRVIAPYYKREGFFRDLSEKDFGYIVEKYIGTKSKETILSNFSKLVNKNVMAIIWRIIYYLQRVVLFIKELR